MPNLLNAGWLTYEGNGIQITGVPGATPSGPVTIRALDGSSRDASGLPVFCYVDDGDRYIVEYRLQRSRWDRGLPDSPNGWVVVYRTPIEGEVTALEVASYRATRVKIISFGGPDFAYLFGAGPLNLAVMNVDPIAGTLAVQFWRHKAKVPEYFEAFEGYRRELKYVLWSPETGFHDFSATSDVGTLLKNVSALSQGRELARFSGRLYTGAINAGIERQREELVVSANAVQLRAESLQGRVVEGLDRLRALVGSNQELAELAKEVENLHSLAREIR